MSSQLSIIIAAAKRVDEASKAYFEADPIHVPVDVVCEYGEALDALRHAASYPSPVSHLLGSEPAVWGHYAADRTTLLNVFYAKPEDYTAYPGEVIVPLRPDFSALATTEGQP